MDDLESYMGKVIYLSEKLQKTRDIKPEEAIEIIKTAALCRLAECVGTNASDQDVLFIGGGVLTREI